MDQRTIFPIHISSGDNFYKNEEQYQKYIKKYEWSDDWCLQYVTALIRNEMWNILVGFNKKHWSRQIPSGKIDLWESRELTVKRETEEETNLIAKKITGIWSSKVILNGMVWQWHFYETEVVWILKANEIDTAEVYKRVDFVKTDTRLWFWITDGKDIVTDPSEILQYWHMFAEIFWTYKFPAYTWLMWGKISLPTDLDKDEQYIQYRDQEKNNLQIKKYKDFLSIIEI